MLQDLKFELSEKHTKFEKNLHHGFDKSADLLSQCQNHEDIHTYLEDYHFTFGNKLFI